MLAAKLKKVTVWLGVCLAVIVVLLASLPWIITVAISHIDLNENITVYLDQAEWDSFGSLKLKNINIHCQQASVLEIHYLQMDFAQFMTGTVKLKIYPKQVNYNKLTNLIKALPRTQTESNGKKLFPLLPVRTYLTVKPFFIEYSGYKFEVVLDASILPEKASYTARVTSELGTQLYVAGRLTEQELSGNIGFWTLPTSTILPSLLHRVRFQPGLTHLFAHYKLPIAERDKSIKYFLNNGFVGVNLHTDNNEVSINHKIEALVKGHAWGIVKLENNSLRNIEAYLWPSSAFLLRNKASEEKSFPQNITLKIPSKIKYQQNVLQSSFWQIDVNHSHYQGYLVFKPNQFDFNNMSSNAVFNFSLQPSVTTFTHKDISFGNYQLKMNGSLDILPMAIKFKLRPVFRFHDVVLNTLAVRRVDITTEQPIWATFQLNPFHWDIKGSLVSRLKGLQIKKVKLPNLDATHDVQLIDQQLDYHMQGRWTSALHWQAQAKLNLLQKQLRVDTQWNTISASKLQRSFSRYSGWPKELSLTSGTFTPRLQLKADWQSEMQWQMNAQLITEQLAGQYQDYQWQGAAIDFGWKIQGMGNQLKFSPLTKNRFKVDQLDVGLPLQMLRGRVVVKNTPSPWLSLQQVKVKALQGSVYVKQIPLLSPHSINSYATFDDISLSELVALQQQPGLSAQGRLQGRLPLRFSTSGITINAGQIQASKSGGFIKLENNPAVEAMKQSRPEFAQAIKALENLHFSMLESSVDLNEKGDAKFKVMIKGYNPALSKTRQVNFNYQHEENMLMLLRSLRFSQRLTDKLRH
ncbi:YdbH domain-containing protein [Zooshikella harenae]|uniref:YdbH domain-containing protein n=1 Tax=Zooshikella harenae TaxID=2827238 RepID=A0ABS5ZE69_9GAMM|nr:YdbH domain-containing protein [Zooshikella harenae]MBU2712359.1 YdbH domain-containing protein [Zooshikella harenae]